MENLLNNQWGKIHMVGYGLEKKKEKSVGRKHIKLNKIKVRQKTSNTRSHHAGENYML